MKDEQSLEDTMITLWHRYFILQDYRQVGKWIRIAMYRAGHPLCDEHDWDPNCKACNDRLDHK